MYPCSNGSCDCECRRDFSSATLLQNSKDSLESSLVPRLSSKRSRLIHSERETVGEDRTRPRAAAEVVTALLEAAIVLLTRPKMRRQRARVAVMATQGKVYPSEETIHLFYHDDQLLDKKL